MFGHKRKCFFAFKLLVFTKYVFTLFVAQITYLCNFMTEQSSAQSGQKTQTFKSWFTTVKWVTHTVTDMGEITSKKAPLRHLLESYVTNQDLIYGRGPRAPRQTGYVYNLTVDYDESPIHKEMCHFLRSHYYIVNTPQFWEVCT